jgi:acyl carrier protein
MAEIEQPITEFIQQLSEGAQGPVTSDTQLLETGLLDSINLVHLIQFIEERFGISIPDGDIGPEIFATPGTLTAYVSKRLAA